MRTPSVFLSVSVAVGGIFLGWHRLAQAMDACPSGTVLYMALEPVKVPLGLNGETRTEYLDRRFPGWQKDKEGIIRADPTTDVAAPVRVSLSAPPGLVIERVDLIAESTIDYIDPSDRRRELEGHREIGHYALEPDTTNDLSVPRAVFRESGALLVAATVRRTDVAGARGVIIAAIPVRRNICPARVYTHDRFTAIRLNRDQKNSRSQ